MTQTATTTKTPKVSKAARAARLPRTVKDTELASYMLERIPRQLLEDTKKKCKALDPPITMKAAIVGLLRQWVSGTKPRF